MKPFYFLIILLMLTEVLKAQDDMGKQVIPFEEIPDAPATFTMGNIMGRLIDGLGYRYYWATENLSSEDISYAPGKDARSISQTIDHILSLTWGIRNTALGEANSNLDTDGWDWQKKRVQTLKYLEEASKTFKSTADEKIQDKKIIFQRGDRKTEFPLWNLINGQISDAIYHTGQIVSFRRSAGNPMDPRVNVFTGKNRQ